MDKVGQVSHIIPYLLTAYNIPLDGDGLESGGERGIRTLDTALTVYRFSKPAPSATRPPLLRDALFYRNIAAIGRPKLQRPLRYQSGRRCGPRGRALAQSNATIEPIWIEPVK